MLTYRRNTVMQTRSYANILQVYAKAVCKFTYLLSIVILDNTT